MQVDLAWEHVHEERVQVGATGTQLLRTKWCTHRKGQTCHACVVAMQIGNVNGRTTRCGRRRGKKAYVKLERVHGNEWFVARMIAV